MKPETSCQPTQFLFAAQMGQGWISVDICRPHTRSAHWCDACPSALHHIKTLKSLLDPVCLPVSSVLLLTSLRVDRALPKALLNQETDSYDGNVLLVCVYHCGLWKLLGIKWYHHVRSDGVRRTTKQPHLSAIVHARRFSHFGHVAWMPDETDAKILKACDPGELKDITLVLCGWRQSNKT